MGTITVSELYKHIKKYLDNSIVIHTDNKPLYGKVTFQFQDGKYVVGRTEETVK